MNIARRSIEADDLELAASQTLHCCGRVTLVLLFPLRGHFLVDGMVFMPARIKNPAHITEQDHKRGGKPKPQLLIRGHGFAFRLITVQHARFSPEQVWPLTFAASGFIPKSGNPIAFLADGGGGPALDQIPGEFISTTRQPSGSSIVMPFSVQYGFSAPTE